jgi:hypothetical protein
VRFDPEDAKKPLEFWDRFEGDLVERALDDENARHCDTLGLYWYVRHDAKLGPTLWLARDPHGREPMLTSLEQERSAREQERNAREQERNAKEQERSAKEQERSAKEAALARVAELEAELRRRS